MKQLLLVCGSMALACAFASADTWTGRLIDNTCAQQQQRQTPQQPPTDSMNSCTPSSATTSFAISDSAGKVYRLDAEGNKKALDAFKKYNSSADRAQNPNSVATAVTATIQGSMKGDEISVDSIDLH